MRLHPAVVVGSPSARISVLSVPSVLSLSRSMDARSPLRPPSSGGERHKVKDSRNTNVMHLAFFCFCVSPAFGGAGCAVAMRRGISSRGLMFTLFRASLDTGLWTTCTRHEHTAVRGATVLVASTRGCIIYPLRLRSCRLTTVLWLVFMLLFLLVLRSLQASGCRFLFAAPFCCCGVPFVYPCSRLNICLSCLISIGCVHAVSSHELPYQLSVDYNARPPGLTAFTAPSYPKPE